MGYTNKQQASHQEYCQPKRFIDKQEAVIGEAVEGAGCRGC